MRQMLQSLNHLHGPLLDSPHYVPFLLVLGRTKLDTESRLVSPVPSMEGEGGLPCNQWQWSEDAPAGYSPRCHFPPLPLGYITVNFLTTSLLPGPLCKAVFQLVGPQPVLMQEATPPQTQDFSIPLALPLDIPIRSLLQPSEVTQRDSTTS